MKPEAGGHEQSVATAGSVNRTRRRRWLAGAVITIAAVAGRPVVNLTLAIDYAIGPEKPAGFRRTNILIHALAALALFGLLRRTLERPSTRSGYYSR